jgi:TonB family protein
VAALSAGRGAAIPPEYDGYVRELRQRIQNRLRYPWLAVRQRVHGVVELEVKLDAEGRLAGVGVTGEGGAVVLREAAIRAVRDVPLPAGPARPLTINPVIFSCAESETSTRAPPPVTDGDWARPPLLTAISLGYSE